MSCLDLDWHLSLFPVLLDMQLTSPCSAECSELLLQAMVRFPACLGSLASEQKMQTFAG